MKRVFLRSIFAFFFAFLVVEVSANSSVSGYSVPVVEVDYGAMGAAELWDMGNAAYANNDYLGAEKAYSAILARDLHSYELYYNLGNLHHRLGNVGQSLLYLYKAQKLNPSDRDVAHNIEVVRLGTVDEIDELPVLFVRRWADWVSSRFSVVGWSVFSLVSLFFALAFFMLYLFSSGLRFKRLGFSFGLLFVVAFAFATLYGVSARDEILNPSSAVVLSKRAVVRSAPDRSSTEIFTLHEGTRVAVEREYGDWCEIRISDGKQGWVRLSSIGKI
ncbi:MAG: SH3 domain-containing protein [Rikenellaceae bacterium]